MVHTPTSTTAERPDASGRGQAGEARPPSPIPGLSLPKGGGAIRGIGETFATSPATGTATLTVPIVTSAGRGAVAPSLSLSYDSGSGNGPFGMGWTLGTAAVTRSTDRGLPQCRDEEESDDFVLSGSETLVPVLSAAGKRTIRQLRLHGIDYDVATFRPRTEGLHARIERWTAQQSGESFWRTIGQDNVTSLYGLGRDERIYDPAHPQRTFSWLLSRTFDDKGNLAVYTYERENDDRVNIHDVHEANRDRASIQAQRYLKRIRYAAGTPWFASWAAEGTQTPLPDLWRHELVLDYGDHNDDAPSPVPDQPLRPDPFSTYRAGFEVRTYRRVRRSLLFHHFPEKPEVGTNRLVRSTDFRYSDDDAPTDPRNPTYTFLIAVRQTGYRRSGTGYLKRSMPPLELEYSVPKISQDVLALDEASMEGLPDGIDGIQAQLLDLEGDGIPGVLSRHEGGWSYKPNLSPVPQRQPDGTLVTLARLGAPATVANLPATGLATDQGQLLDLAGDGRPDFVVWEGPTPGFHERTVDGGWTPFRAIPNLPRLDWDDPNLRFVDLTGDGRADLLLTADDCIIVHESLGEDGFASAERIPAPWDERAGPRAVFADGTRSLYLADMSGDGLNDLVRVRNGEVCYWPNLGYGRFGRQVTMGGAPRLVDDDRYDPGRVRLADIDGTGTSDLLYVGDDGVWMCFNRSGNDFGEVRQLAVFPDADARSPVQVADLLGTGTACLVWSPAGLDRRRQPVRYVDLMGGQKPHLLVTSRNNLGAETRIRYAPSTRFALEDSQSGRPWATRLPFPVHVVDRVETYDWIGRTRSVTRYAYHHGHFDGTEREFRGFGMVERWDTIELRDDTAFPEVEALNWDTASWSSPVLTRTWYHTGAFEEAGAISRSFADEYWVEPALRPAERAAQREATMLPDSVLPSGLTPAETHEAHRALRGTTLRTEVYAADNTAAAEHPYAVTEQCMTVERLQPHGPNRYAVFAVLPCEALSFDYERVPDDPRVTHEVTLETDQWGNVLRSVSIGYPRRTPETSPEPTLTQQFREMLAHDQNRLHMTATHHTFTTPIVDPAVFPNDHRTPLPAESVVAEVTGVAPALALAGITNRFTRDELDRIWSNVWNGAHDIAYEEVLAAEIDGVGGTPATPTRRVIAHTRTRYRRDDLTGLLRLGQLEPRALTGESWQLALTPRLLVRMFGTRVTAAELAEGGYVQVPDHAGWWVPTGRVFLSSGDDDTPAQELADARAHFFLTRRAIDPFGNITRVRYELDLVPVETVDPVGNTTTAEIDYRVLAPSRVTDANGSRVDAAFDVHGNVVANAVRGTAAENTGDALSGFDPDPDGVATEAILADPLGDPAATIGDASIRMVYDLFGYFRTRNQPQPSPAGVYTISRERHVNGADPLQAAGFQHTFAYSDGFGREIQRKIRAKDGPLLPGGPPVSSRWVGTGWTVYDNKGRAVATYEPFFTRTHAFEFARVEGVATINVYDPPGRLVATLSPDATWTKVVFDAWRQERWDANDTVATRDSAAGAVVAADPREDPNVGAAFRRILGDRPFVSWWRARVDDTVGSTPAQRAAERDAADKAAAHLGTPAVTHLDALGRVCLDVSANADGARYPTRTALDAEAKPLAVIDARGRRVQEYCLREPLQAGGFRYVAGFDLVGNPLYRNGMDDGERRSLVDVHGASIRSWDGKGRIFRIRYDALRRPTHHYRTDGAAEVLIERSVYGEAAPADRRLRGRLWRTYDGAGLAVSERYDFKGNLTASTRTLARAYRGTIDWSALDALDDPVDLDAAAAPSLSHADHFLSLTKHDALSRPVQVVAPHSPTMRPSVLRPGYDAAGLPDTLDVWIGQANAPAGLLDPTTADYRVVAAVDHDARGQRTAVTLGNGTVSTYEYDPLTLRLRRLRTARPATFVVNRRVVQDLSYAYDPVGNVTRIRDEADTQNVVFFQNRRVDPTADYTYDAVYRLVAATGREHLGQTGGALDPPRRVTSDDALRISRPHPSDGRAMATYTETYTHDDAGNLMTMVHTVSSGTWTREYRYGEPSRVVAGQTGDRLSTTREPGRLLDAAYTYDAHGLTTRMPHLPQMAWDDSDQLTSTTRQVFNGGTPETTHYVYAGAGNRLRKVTDRAAPASREPTRREERITLGPIELHRIYNSDGTTVMRERETLSVMFGTDRAALIETRTLGTDRGPAQLVRFQLGNHLGSATLELDDGSDIISYEEYFPFGSTAYQAVRSQSETPKRYRFTAQERDQESDLSYHGTRYYAPWLGRWTAPDREGLSDGLNRYAYVRNCPIRLLDPTGTQGESFEDLDDVIKELNESEIVKDRLTDKRAPLAPRSKPWDAKEARKYANAQAADYRSSAGMNQGATVQAGHTAAARHAPESGISEADWDKQPMQQLHSRRGQGLDVDVVDQHGNPATRTRHTAQEGLIDDAVGRVKAANGGKLTPQGQLDAAAEVDWRTSNTPLDQRNVDAVRNGGLAAPEKGPKVDPKTGEVVKAETAAVKTEAKALKSEAKALKAGADMLETAGKTTAKTALKKLGTKALKVIPFVGISAGVASAGYEASQGNSGTAALDAVGLIPVVGDVVDAARLGVEVGETANELLGISNVAAEHGTFFEGLGKSAGLGEDNARIVGAIGAGISSITVAPAIAWNRTVSGWFN
ncbi:SpvB/TcaC N-terminal domain-containing protein [Nocardia sp. NPDC052278]|uniref:SpvB/TcaC N-terminal domain-containing protein n=1 Tax=unclassified Nocardia TaxID=2637762 RepID=UPI003682B4A0